MEKRSLAFLYLLSLFFIVHFYSVLAQKLEDVVSETYIVFVNLPTNQILSRPEDLETYHRSFIPMKSVSSNEPTPALIYSYQHVISGFAAKLTAEDIKSMETKKGFLSAHPQRILDLHTTHTPAFLGLHKNVGIWQGSNFGKGVIIGVLDTGIFPNHPSFNDEGLPLPPTNWKGQCEFDKKLCNNKLIGARTFLKGAKTPLDNDGHGTHTASTAAGNFVKGANFLGQANGTASGMAPLAHLAIYQVCHPWECSDSDILAGIDAAINDGVNLLSLSLGDKPKSLYSDAVAIAAFSAIKKGILVICSAGNDGPRATTVSNGAPWILTVGASTMDRRIRSTVVLGNKKYNGETLAPKRNFPINLPIVYVGRHFDFNNSDVKNKIVLFELENIADISDERYIWEQGASGIIIMNSKTDGFSTLANRHRIPAAHISHSDGVKIRQYLESSTESPFATMKFVGTIMGDKVAPEVISFSSRGPNFPSPGILKPDIIGPGVNVLGASGSSKSRSSLGFEIMSGTSMACPHLSGTAALLKNSHPEWSPAAIKSAIMTTADIVNLDDTLIVDERHETANLFAVGSGHVNPSRASNPGILYDITPDDYIPYLCGLEYTDKQIEIITHTKVNCSEVKAVSEAGLNYPSFSIALDSKNQTYRRIVTNVGPSKSIYNSSITKPPGVEVIVKPNILVFSEANQKLTYEVTFSRSSPVQMKNYVQGYLLWSSTTSVHYARSPVSVELLSI